MKTSTNLQIFGILVIIILRTCQQCLAQHAGEYRKFCTKKLHTLMDDSFVLSLNTTLFNSLSKELLAATFDKKMEGGTFQEGLEIQRNTYLSISSNTECIKTICEIGFNNGNSALMWLLSNPSAKVVMFDLFTHAYSAVAENFLRSKEILNTSRLSIIKGSSLDTVPLFFRNNSNFKCDLLSVDGAHSYDAAVMDIENMMQLANPAWNVLLVDDTNCWPSFCVDAAVNEHVRRGNLVAQKKKPLSGGRRGFSVLHYRIHALHANQTAE